MTCYNSELPIGPPGPTGPIGPQGPQGTTLGYKIYSALLTQVGVNPPTAIELENTLGESPQWFYDTVGSYYCTTTTDIFTADKTYIQMSMGDFNEGGFNLFYNKSISLALIGLTVCDKNGDPIDGAIYRTAIEIRVYP